MPWRCARRRPSKTSQAGLYPWCPRNRCPQAACRICIWHPDPRWPQGAVRTPFGCRQTKCPESTTKKNHYRLVFGSFPLKPLDQSVTTIGKLLFLLALAFMLSSKVQQLTFLRCYFFFQFRPFKTYLCSTCNRTIQIQLL
jgi:uncharacterized protein YlaI